MPAAVKTTDVGTKFRITVKDEEGVVVDISSASTREIIFKAPSGALKTFSAVNVTDGIDGQLEYVTVLAADIDEAGDWQWQARVVIGSGDWKSEVKRFNVVAPLTAS